MEEGVGRKIDRDRKRREREGGEKVEREERRGREKEEIHGIQWRIKV
jgi:hypothetical protein